MTREQILARINELDRQINTEVGKTRLTSLNNRHSTFPIGSWIASAVLAGVGFYGPAFLGDLIRPYALYILIAAGLGALFALYQTAMFIKGKLSKGAMPTAAMSEKVRALQNERQELQRKLKEIQG